MIHGLSNNTHVRNIIPFFHPCDLYFINLYRVHKCEFRRIRNPLSFTNPIGENRSIKHNKHITEVDMVFVPNIQELDLYNPVYFIYIAHWH